MMERLIEQQIPRRILLTMVGTGLFCLALGAASLLWVTRTVDQMAAENARLMVENRIFALTEAQWTLIDDYSDWEQAFDWITARDDAAVAANIGGGVGDGAAFDRMFITSPQDTLLYAFGGAAADADPDEDASTNEADTSQADFADIGPDLVAAVRAIPPDSAEYVQHFVASGGHIGLFSAGIVRPGDLDGLDHDRLPVMIAGVWLDTGNLANAGRELMIEGLAVSPPGPGTVDRPETGRLMLLGPDGAPVARITWINPRPGQVILQRLAPVLGLIGVLLIVVCGTVGQQSARQAREVLLVRRLAQTDALTGLSNRAGFQNAVQAMTVQGSVAPDQMAVLYIDLDGFKGLNDSIGHDAGDEALRHVADRLRAAVRDTDVVARIGGDEFVCILQHSDPLAAALAGSERMHRASDSPIRLSGAEHHLRHSIGIAVGDIGSTVSMLITQADAAMYEAKKQGGGHSVRYTPGNETDRRSASQTGSFALRA